MVAQLGHRYEVDTLPPLSTTVGPIGLHLEGYFNRLHANSNRLFTSSTNGLEVLLASNNEGGLSYA